MSRSSIVRGLRRVALAGAACIAAGVACYGATEVRIDISTDLPCIAMKGDGGSLAGPVHTLVRLGGGGDAPIVADTSACSDHAGADGFRDIGSIVVVPSGDRSARVTVQVSATADGSPPDECGRPEASPQTQAQCIVARRTFTFIKHTSRSLPIRLYSVCKGQICGAAETCNKLGKCESAVVDDRGCTASDVGCQGVLPAVMPDVDAGDAGDGASSTDGGDGGPSRPPCTAADGGTNVVTTGSATDLLAVNGTKVFYVGPGGIAGSSMSVYAIDKKDFGAPVALFSFFTAVGTATALAADDAAVWVASESTVYRYDLASAQRGPGYAIASTRSLATTNGGAALALTAENGGAGPGSTYRLGPGDKDVADISPGTLGTQIANGGPGAIWVYKGTAAKGDGIERISLLTGTTQHIKVAEPWGGMAADGTSLLFGSNGQVQRIDPPSATPTFLYDIANVGLVAADATSSFAFFLQKTPGAAAVIRGPKGGAAVPPMGFSAVPLATGYGDVKGLAVDDTCVYFWSISKASVGDGVDTLNAYPKDRNAGPTPAATIHRP